MAQPGIDHWETVVTAGQPWAYLPATAEPPGDWHQPSFDDASWPQGPGGFGYGDGDDATDTGPVTTLYIRTTFTIVDSQAIGYAVLHADYDDAFIAYLNGVEIARANIGVVGDSQPFGAPSVYFREAQMYRGGSPEYFELNEEEVRTSLRQGENTLAIQIHNDNPESTDLSALFYLSIGVQDSSTYYLPVPEWFQPPVFLWESNLPIVQINTQGQVILDDPRITAQLQISHKGNDVVNNIEDAANVYDGQISIEIRGSSSQIRFPKKSYGLETQKSDGSNNNVSLLGMPEENDWILIGPYSDKTLLRNDLLYHLARKMGQYAPRTRLCELVINQKYQGVYVLTEKIKRDKNRVDIAKLKETDNAGDQLTGGYIIKLDKTTGSGGSGWYSSHQPAEYDDRQLFFQYEYPDEEDITFQQADYIEQFFHDVESALMGEEFKDSLTGYRKYIDVQSFIDFFLANELSYNVDGYRLSTFMYKDRDTVDGKLHMGPVWDFNLAFGNGWDCLNQNTTGLMIDFNKNCHTSYFQIPFWWDRLLEDSWFRDELRCSWESYRRGPLHTDSIMTYIDQQVAYIETAQARNFVRWPILPVKVWPNFYHADDYQGEVELVKSWIKDRLTWLDQHIPGNCSILRDADLSMLSAIVYPNPATATGYIEFYLPLDSRVNLHLFNMQGQLVRELIRDEVRGAGYYKTILPLSHLPKGIYNLSLKAVNERLTFKLVKF